MSGGGLREGCLATRPVLKPDRGSEFLISRPSGGRSGGKRTSVYYCDPAKPGPERLGRENHEELRKILPGTVSSFDSLTQRVSLICSQRELLPGTGHVRAWRKSLELSTSTASQVLPESLLARLGIMRGA